METASALIAQVNLASVVIIALAGFCSGIIKTGVGVGAGIFLLPTLSLAFPAKIALGLGAPMMLASDIIGLRYYWKQWLERRALLRLLAAVVPGLILGAVLLPLIPGRVFRICVGIFGACYALCLLWQGFPLARLLKRLFGRVDARLAGDQDSAPGAWLYGFLGGLATVLAHAGGVVWSLYLVKAAPDRRIFVGTTIIMFFLTNIYKVVSYIHLDILPLESLVQVLPAIPMILLGSHLGNVLNKRINQALFRKIVLCCILCISITLCR